MDAYKKQIEIRICLLSILDFIFVGLLIYDQFGADPSRKGSTAFSFLCGLAAAGTLLISAKIIQYRKILHDEAKLRLNYNKENDERTKEIRRRSGMPMVLIFSVLMILAGVIAGYFNETIFITLLAAALCQMLISAIVKVYYLKNM